MDPSEIVKCAISAPSADNSQSWCFHIAPDSLTCSYLHRASSPDPFGPMGHANLIASGALLENLDVIASPYGCNPEWEQTRASWQIILNQPNKVLTASPEITSRLSARHTNRHPYLSLGENDLRNLPNSATCRAVTINSPSHIQTLAYAIMQCAIARFNCKELHEWLFSSLRWTPQEVDSGTGLDINTLHLPPGGRAFMRLISPWPRMALLNRFGMGRMMATADAALVREAPAIIAIVSGESPQEIVGSGQLMQRIWLELNARGVAVHPYYVLTDQWNRRKNGKLDPKWNTTIDNAIAMVNEALGLATEEHIHMLLRVGRPSCSPVRSRRIPASAFMDTSITSC